MFFEYSRNINIVIIDFALNGVDAFFKKIRFGKFLQNGNQPFRVIVLFDVV